MTVSLLWRRSMLLLYSMHTAFAYSQNVSANVSSSLSGAHETSLSESTLLLSTMPSPGLELIPTANPDRPRLEVTTVEGDEGGVMFTNPAEATARVSMNMPHIESSRSDLLDAADRATASQADIPQITTPPLIIGPELFAPIDGGIGGYANNEHALLPGGPAVILTLTRPVTTVVTLSLASDASQVFINGKPTSLSPQPQQNQRLTTQLPILTINGYVLTPLAHPTPLSDSPNEIQSDSPTAYILPDGQTLLPGATVVFQGTPISLASGATQLVVGKSTSDIVLVVETIQDPSRQGTEAPATDAATSTRDVASAVESQSVGGANRWKMGCLYGQTGTLGTMLFSVLTWL